MAITTPHLTFEEYLAVVSETQGTVIRLNEPVPLLAVEVVSEFTKTTDYRKKRTEYSIRGIPEYWIVDPLIDKVTVCTLEEGLYECAEYQGSDRILSPTFPNLTLTAEQVLKAEL